MMLCRGPNYECNLYWGNTSSLEVVVWWFLKSSGVCEIVARTNGSGRLSSSVLSDEFGSLGTNTDNSSYLGTILGVADRGRGKFIPAYGLLGGGLQAKGRVNTHGSKERLM